MADTIEVFRDDETSHGAYRADVPGSPRQAELTWVGRGDALAARFGRHVSVVGDA